MRTIAGILGVREVFALVAAAFVPGIIVAMPALIIGDPREAMWVFINISEVSLFVSATMGLISVVTLNYLGMTKKAYYALIGIFVSMALSMYFIIPNILVNGLLGWPSYAAQFVILSALSVGSSLIYWLMARPDKIC